MGSITYNTAHLTQTTKLTKHANMKTILTLIALAALMSSCTKQPVGYLAVPLYAEDVKEIQAK